MLYYFFTWLHQTYDTPGMGVFRYITFRAGAAAITALVIAFWLGPKIIERLKARQIGEAAKVEAPKNHLSKAGTPTMGGLIVLTSIFVPALLWTDISNMYVRLILFVTVALGAVGFLDDYLKVVKKKPKGLIGRYKIAGQVLVGTIVGGVIYFLPDLFDPHMAAIKSSTTVPFVKNLEFDFGLLYIPVVVFVITATSNAVNLTDGLDGLAIGTVGIVSITLAIIAYMTGHIELSQYLTIPYQRGTGELAIFCVAMAGAALGFLWFNSYPAQVFMGDTGSLALGGIIGAMCVLLKKELLLPTLGGVFLMETLSVIIQKSYFKYTKRKYGEGRRVFRMAPIHHHFELLGWPEPKIVTRFYIVAILLMIISLATFKVR
ncbi:MAG: phospho-N-acetylmuramoyl-pentapeptide-transferase [Ignavibacteria bacterium GWA2_55_11]|nr:MAG: phospho-N-acetylmuramoyl-pentapeptide-transferase [Ignavibacteria bacterium GWA2_55_11]OGU47056.1 MAG: phospho-N-acetylmuramoyl-pentapeptide-transferase [Ignavibacteria bacterium GWC2_56_12]OGU65700.1 MAG: phospho-N-acetylmuramoyl-pentapeptide-transferase [Ignavibacteria bacterium RIFCSPHIGHO2_02_FULL_56_12]OGU72576.1 MAG: phospho-N-acetylmuramoyl-pentapeptide-transferase [Ignavibacteria bacterium RIFCSPLOWO2_02_FULL_55_14]OGU74732.1 MAG: phospho-N-acetylmuramoyl-pentapeptide-transferas